MQGQMPSTVYRKHYWVDGICFQKVKDKMTRSNLTIADILTWIFENREDMDSMDSINKMTFPFTTRYDDLYGKKGKK